MRFVTSAVAVSLAIGLSTPAAPLATAGLVVLIPAAGRSAVARRQGAREGLHAGTVGTPTGR